MLWLIEKTFFDQQGKSHKRTYDNIRKIATSKGDEYTTGCLLDYPYFKDYYKMMAIYLSKQQALYSDPKAIHQIDFTGIKAKGKLQQCFSLLKKQKKLF